MAARRSGAAVPVWFKCPISLELMKDPVTLCTGQTYDRGSIAAWLGKGNTTCPATMVQLETLEVVPNHTLRRLIQEWCRRRGGTGESCASASEGGAERVAALMRDIAACSGAELGALKELRGIASSCVRDAGGVGLVTALLRETEGAQEVCEEAVAVLAALVPVCDHEQLKLELVGSGGAVVASVAGVLSAGSLEARVNAATVVAALSATTDLHFHNAAEVFASLGKLLREDLYPRAVKSSLRALVALCKHRRNRAFAVEAGVVPALIELLPELPKANAERALCVLELMCAMAEGRAAVMDHDLAMAVFVSQFHTISAAATEYIVSILWLLCQAAPESLSAAQQAGVFAPLLLLLQMECAPKTRHQCGELLKQVKVTAWKEISCDPHFFLPFITTV